MGVMAAAAAACAFAPSLARDAEAVSPPLSDVIVRVEQEEKEYLVRTNLHLVAYQHDIRADIQYRFNLRDAPIVWPIIPDGGFHITDMNRLKRSIALDDRVVPNYQGELLPATSLDVQFLKFVIEESDGKQVDLHIEQYITVYDAKVDEKRAQEIDWPSSFPPEVQSALAPTWFVQSTNDATARLAEAWTKGNPRAMKPYLLAKYLAKQTVEYYQPEGRTLIHDNHTKLTGIRVQGSDFAAKNRKGSWHDMVTLYVGVLRANGIPARPVIGIDTRVGNSEDALVSWAEFYLPTAGWVSVDLRRLKESPGMMHTLNRPWEGFGTNDRLNELIPLAHHFHPPYHVQAEGREKYMASKRNQYPLLWGWIPVPDPIPTDQQLSINVMDAPKRGDTPRPGDRGGRGRRGG